MSAIERYPALLSPFPVVSDLIPYVGMYKTVFPEVTKNPAQMKHATLYPNVSKNPGAKPKTKSAFGMVAPTHYVAMGTVPTHV
jgi:hypothetical protein